MASNSPPATIPIPKQWPARESRREGEDGPEPAYGPAYKKQAFGGLLTVAEARQCSVRSSELRPRSRLVYVRS